MNLTTNQSLQAGTLISRRAARLGACLAGSLLAALSYSPSASATQYSDTEVELLRGLGAYKQTPSHQEILSISYAGGWAYGDTYYFTDFGDVGDDFGGESHTEWSARLSLPRTFGDGQWDGFVKDVYAIGEIDLDHGQFANKRTDLFGISFDFKVPKFQFFSLHVQLRDDPTYSGSTYQVTPVWNLPFEVAGQKFTFEGFADFDGSEGASKANVLSQPKVVWHISDHIGVGFEYQYWHNRLGIDGLDESTMQVLARWTF